MGKSKESFMEYREYLQTLEAVKSGKSKPGTLLRKTCELAQIVALGHSGDIKGFRLLVQCNFPPKKAAYLTLGPSIMIDTSKVAEPKNKFGDWWDEWQNNPDRYDESRDNNLSGFDREY